MPHYKTILPAAAAAGAQATTLGVMGGGQLGRMFVHAAQQLGYFTAVLDPDVASPAGLVSHVHVQTDYLDEQGLAQMLQRCAAITTEFENVPAGALYTLGAHLPTAPDAEAVAVCQDRAKEKRHFVDCGVPCAPHALIQTEADLATVPDALLPGILKTVRMGYDGKGQARVADRAELAAAWQALRQAPCVLEHRLALDHELSVVLARNAHGDVVTLPLQRNLHRDGVLAVTEAPAPGVSDALALPYRCRWAPAMASTPVQSGVRSRPSASNHRSPSRFSITAAECWRGCSKGSPVMQRTCSSNCETSQLSTLWWPELCGRGAISLATSVPSASTKNSTHSTPT